jgi:hypothetical protein
LWLANSESFRLDYLDGFHRLREYKEIDSEPNKTFSRPFPTYGSHEWRLGCTNGKYFFMWMDPVTVAGDGRQVVQEND